MQKKLDVFDFGFSAIIFQTYSKNISLLPCYAVYAVHINEVLT